MTFQAHHGKSCLGGDKTFLTLFKCMPKYDNIHKTCKVTFVCYLNLIKCLKCFLGWSQLSGALGKMLSFQTEMAAEEEGGHSSPRTSPWNGIEWNGIQDNQNGSSACYFVFKSYAAFLCPFTLFLPILFSLIFISFGFFSTVFLTQLLR